jgi:hypothetical protein
MMNPDEYEHDMAEFAGLLRHMGVPSEVRARQTDSLRRIAELPLDDPAKGWGFIASSVELLPFLEAYERGAGHHAVADLLARLALSYSLELEMAAELVAFAGAPKPEDEREEPEKDDE